MDLERVLGVGGPLRGTARIAAVAAAILAVSLAAGGGPAGASAAPGGIISTLAGGPGGPALATKVASFPCGVAFGGGSLYIGATTTVRKVSMATDRLTTIAGNGTPGFSGDGGLGTSAQVNAALGAAADSAGNAVIGDTGNDRVRVVATHGGMFYGEAMVAGDIYAVAATGIRGFTGDGGPARQAELYHPEASR